VFFLVLTSAAILWVRVFWDVHQQNRNIWTFLLCGACFLCLLLWLLVLSRLSWRTRLSVLGIILLLHGAVLGLVRIKGVDGDLVPVVVWRWGDRAGAAPVTEPPSTSGAGLELAADGLQEWPQFLGPNRDGTVSGIRLSPDWVSDPPREVWRSPVGPGWSGFAISGGRAVTLEQDGQQEVVSCFDARTGQRLWRHAYEARYATTIAGEGPRATPSVVDGRVYAVGATGWLTCLRLADGEALWSRNIVKEHGGRLLEWGFSMSPLVVEDRVIVSVGGTNDHSLVALDPLTGATVWGGGTDTASYSSPIACELAGHPQVVVFNMASVAGHDPATGRVVWERPYDRAQVHVAVPLILEGDRVLVSSGYGHGSELYQVAVDGEGIGSAELVWKSRRMKAKFTNLIAHDGFIYGLDDGILACISAATGELQWKDGRYGHGQMLRVGEHALVTTETGNLILIQLDPEALRPVGEVSIFSGKFWNPPALAGRYLFLRTDREAVCMELAVIN
jgi:outer membrane protein assembly factor BamB